MSSSLDKIKNFTVDEVPTYTDHYSASEIIRLPIDICKQCEEGQLKALVESVMARYRDSKVAIEQSIADVAVHDPDAIAIATAYSERVLTLIDIAAERGLYEVEDTSHVNDMLDMLGIPAEERADELMRDLKNKLMRDLKNMGLRNSLGIPAEARADELMRDLKNMGLRTRIAAESKSSRADYGPTTSAGFVGFSPLAIKHAAQGNLREKMYPAFMAIFQGFAQEILRDPDKVKVINKALTKKKAGWQLSEGAIETLKIQTKNEKRGLFSLGAYAASRERSRHKNSPESLKSAVDNNPQIRDLQDARIPLSEREVISQTGGLDNQSNERVRWETGGSVWAIDNHPSVKAAIDSGDVMVAGISGTADTLLTLGHTLGLFDGVDKGQKLDNAVLSLAAWMVDGRNHSVHEVRTSAKSFGIEYTAGPESYKSLKSGDATFQEQLRETQANRGYMMPDEYLSEDNVREVFRQMNIAELNDSLTDAESLDSSEAESLEGVGQEKTTVVSVTEPRELPTEVLLKNFHDFKATIQTLRENEAFQTEVEESKLGPTQEISVAFSAGR